ncbi:MAG: ABC transporter ATP-binding protein/permease [bacterium]|nr:ABC transporter ATP-binding protein/permease [bacterium]
MLKLKNIKKSYYVGNMEIQALKGLNVQFRKNEFVSILGPSGCGKTTLLNIIGGLDKYTDGDLFIQGRSTKEFNDRDWDVYRNHRIGFIFQSYNLIPHQSVLGNVELALTIAGISKEERVARAKKALDRVGLSSQYNKKPNQLSGGQCQRVAIARALVNEPEILLADEPTGALDTETSIQIMDLIKEIANERLVIMVTHNPELAEKYSTRIVRCLDGLIIDDTNPFSEEDEAKEIAELNRIEEEKEKENEAAEKKVSEGKLNYENKKKAKAKEKAKMSFITAFKLSARNLWSKFRRTLMIGIAGSIGIIGVSSVLAVSSGVHGYIDSMQDDMLSGNPIAITKTGIDYETLMDSSSFETKAKAVVKEGVVNVNSLIDFLVNNQKTLSSLSYNNEFNKEYINYVKSMPKEYYNDIVLDYGIDVTQSIYTDYVCGKDGVKANYNGTISLAALNATYSQAITHLDQEAYGKYSDMITGLTTPMSQCVSNNNYILSQYDLKYGNMPQNPNDVLVVLDPDSRMSDLMLAQLGYYSQEDFYHMIYNSLGYTGYENWKSTFEYEEILDKTYTWYPNNVVYEEVVGSNPKQYYYNYKTDDSWQSYSKNDLSFLDDKTGNKGVTLNVCGIVVPKKDISYGALKTGLLYSEDLARYMISVNKKSALANYLLASGMITSGEYGTGMYGQANQLKAGDPIIPNTYYERKKMDYVLTTDTKVTEGKHYYVKQAVGDNVIYQPMVITGSEVKMNTYYEDETSYMVTEDTMTKDSSTYYIYFSFNGFKGYVTIDTAINFVNGLRANLDPSIPEPPSVEAVLDGYNVSDLKAYIATLNEYSNAHDYKLTVNEDIYVVDGSDIKYVLTKDKTFDASKQYYYQMSLEMGIIYNLEYYWEKLNGEKGTPGTLISGQDSGIIYLGEANNMMSVMMSYFGMGGSSLKTTYASTIAASENPTSIRIYPINFDEKNKVTDYLDNWNKEDVTVSYYDYDFNFTPTEDIVTLDYDDPDRNEIKYTDSVGLIIGMINTMVDIVTYALIAFTALSLVVSSVMIAIITYVSVMERIKEIGVIRALGGRKRDVSHLFNAETFIIGFGSGVIGVGVTYILQIFINLIVNAASHGSVKTIANLKPLTALIMIVVSVLLTSISGLIPARSAAKKDPVVALRTE